MTSTTNRTEVATRPPISREKTASAIAVGTAISVASPVMSSVPTTAFRIPPPVALRSPGGSAVKNSSDSERIPWLTRNAPIATRGMTATTSAAQAQSDTAHAPGEPLADEDGEPVDDHGDHQEHEPERDQRLGMELLVRLVEL